MLNCRHPGLCAWMGRVGLRVLDTIFGDSAGLPQSPPVSPCLHRSASDEFQKSRFDRQAADFSLLDHPGLNILHLSCLKSRRLSCLSSRHLSCLNSRHLSCLNRRHLSCLNGRWNSYPASGRQLLCLLLRQDRCLLLRQDRCCLLYTSPSPRDRQKSRMPSSA